MSIEPKYKDHAAAKAAGWHSRRHETDVEAKVSKEKMRVKKGRSLKKDNKTK